MTLKNQPLQANSNGKRVKEKNTQTVSLPSVGALHAYLKHCIAVRVGKSCFKTREFSLVVLFKIKVFHAHLRILDINLTVTLWNCNEIRLFP